MRIQLSLKNTYTLPTAWDHKQRGPQSIRLHIIPSQAQSNFISGGEQ